MQAMVEYSEESIECDFVYPYNEPPTIVAGLMGSQSWQKPSYNAKLVLPSIIELPSEFVIKSGAKTYRGSVKKQCGNDVYCEVSTILPDR
jgi:hypothetical protein